MIASLQEILQLVGKPITGVLHCGAYIGEEYPIYKAAGIEEVIFVEANSALIPQLIKNVGQKRVVHKALYKQSGLKLPFNLCYSDDRTNLGCSSLLELGKHAFLYPMIKKVGQIEIETITIDEILKDDFVTNFLNMDLQGSELDALHGATENLKFFDAIYTEYSKEPLYKGSCTLASLDYFLHIHGFYRKMLYPVTEYWGDALYLKEYLKDYSYE